MTKCPHPKVGAVLLRGSIYLSIISHDGSAVVGKQPIDLGSTCGALPTYGKGTGSKKWQHQFHRFRPSRTLVSAAESRKFPPRLVTP